MGGCTAGEIFKWAGIALKAKARWAQLIVHANMD